MDPGKMQAKIRLMKMMLRNGRTALRELQSHENFLTKLNEELIETIQDMENSTTLNVRALLQQQDVLATIIDILEYSNKKRLQQLKSELQEWEEKKKCKMSCTHPVIATTWRQGNCPFYSSRAAGGAAECQD